MVRQKTRRLRYLLSLAMVGFWFGLVILPLPVAQATVLGDLAASMPPSTWAKFSPTNKSVANDAQNWAGYSDSATWDPTSKKFLFWGAAAHGVPYRFVVYTDSTGAWSQGPNPPSSVNSNTFAHGNDHNTIDPATGRFYLLIAADAYVVTSNQTLYRLVVSTGAWTTLPSPPTPGGNPLQSEINAIAWFPERNSVVLVRGANGQVLEFSEATQSWTVLGTITTPGTNVYAEYSKACACVILMSGTTNQVWRLDANGSLTRKNNVGTTLYTGSGWYGHVTAEPITGKLLVLSAGQGATFTHQLLIYDPVLDTWTQGNNPPATFEGGMVGTPVSTYGVVLYAICGRFDSCDADMWVYKHSGVFTPDTTPPSPPSSLVASAVSSSQINLSWTASTDNVGVAGYRVERCQGAGCSTYTQIASPSGTSYSDTGLTGSTSYSYRVRANDAAGNLSSYSATASVTTQATPPPPPPGTGIVVAYAFDESSGTTVIDASGNNRTGNISGATRTTSGKYGNTLSFNEVNSGVMGPSYTIGSQFTMMGWIYNPSNTTYESIVTVGKFRQFYLHNGAPEFYDGVVERSFGGALPLNTWHHVATTYDGSQLRMYVNGSIVGSPQSVSLGSYTGVIEIGFWNNGTSDFFGGLIDEVRIYDRALSQSEVQLDMNTPIGTPPDPDTIAPSTPINFSASAISTSQINLSWAASTDNIGVTGYRMERCLGAGCTSFSQIATPSGTSYSDTGLTPNMSYSYRVRANDAAGNLSGNSSTVSSTTLATPPSSTSADADFQARCNAPGVVKCVGFDNTTSDIVSNVNLFPGGDGVIHGALDTSIKASGAGSLKFTLPTNGGANAAGSWYSNLGGNFGQNSTFYVQFRQRISPELLTPSNGGGGFKQVIFHHSSATCASVEITTQNQFYRGYPQMYSQCGNDGFYTDLNNGDFLLQNGTGFQCHYQSPTSRTPPCGYYHTNEWMTFYYRIQIGTWGQANSSIQAWMGYDDGQPLKQFINMTNHRLDQNNPGDGSLYNSVTLLPYDTSRSSASQTSFAWYDELIVSTQPIPAPDASTASQQPPPAPTGLTLQ